MREIKFRAWMKHTVDNRFSWAYQKADQKETNIRNNGFDVLPHEEDEWRHEFLEQWDKEHKPEEQYTIRTFMAFDDEYAIHLNGKHTILYGYEILGLMQFTGLHDKNGVEIYEGDILRYKNSPNYVVSFERDRWALIVRTKDGTGTSSILNVLDFMEVVGNIHENPELNKGAEHE